MSEARGDLIFEMVKRCVSELQLSGATSGEMFTVGVALVGASLTVATPERRERLIRELPRMLDSCPLGKYK